MSEAAAMVQKLQPKRSDVVVVDLVEEAGADELNALAAELGEVAAKTKATVLLLPVGVTIDTIDEREMLARGWMRVGPLAHTSEQLTAPPAVRTDHIPSA